MAEYQESTSITFEWNLKSLKNLFESSRGEMKSRVTRSARFGGGKWQILFYANSGEGNFVSLYLNCEPTQEEKDNAVNGKWVREGLFKFSFELRNASKSTIFNMKEACDHTFSSRTQNWGWAQFAKRDAVYFSSSAVRQADSFTVLCTITSSPIVPTAPSRVKKRAVPTGMLDVVGGLLDDPTYSDIEFVFPVKRGRSAGPKRREEKRIWACKKLLCRADYFDSMFNSGFSETSASMIQSASSLRSLSLRDHSPDDDIFHVLDDSDLEDEAAEAENLDLSEDIDRDDTTEEFSTPVDEHNTSNTPRRRRQSEVDAETNSNDISIEESETLVTGNDAVRQSRNMGDSSSLSSHEKIDLDRDTSPETVMVDNVPSAPEWPGPPKVRVVVRDVAYTTYRAVLYYLYTDSIIFAPLASSFLHKTKKHSRSQSQRVTADIPIDTPRDGEESISSVRPGLSRRTTQFMTHANNTEGSNIGIGGNVNVGLNVNMGMNANLPSGGGSVVGGANTVVQGLNTMTPTTRVQWVRNWGYENPGRPLPCSAKAVYRLADKLDLMELKERAREHIVKSLTVTNVPHEVFSSFSAAFEDIRKVQMDYFLANWGEIRNSEAMSNVWQQIRNGRHPGFEDVWPLIAQNLEYRATQAEGTVGDGGRDGMVAE